MITIEKNGTKVEKRKRPLAERTCQQILRGRSDLTRGLSKAGKELFNSLDHTLECYVINYDVSDWDCAEVLTRLLEMVR